MEDPLADSKGEGVAGRGKVVERGLHEPECLRESVCVCVRELELENTPSWRRGSSVGQRRRQRPREHANVSDGRQGDD